MTWFIIGVVVGAIAKTLIPWPAMDDKVREGWRWLRAKIQ